MNVRSTEGLPRTSPSSNSSESSLDWARLAEHLIKSGITFDTGFEPERFSSGLGNLNFHIRIDGESAVLRRPPFGPIPPGANDMAREFRILDNLNNEFPLAPRALHFCGDPEILGAPFFIMEYRQGTVIGADIAPAIENRWDNDEPIGAFLSRHLIEILAHLHGIDPVQIGLDRLGKPDGFIPRTVTGWTIRADLAWENNPPSALGRLLDWLEKYMPADSTPSLIHNDFKLDNVILDSTSLKPVAVIDWDMGTRGARLYDLAVLLSYWTEKNDPPVMHKLRQMPTAGHGFPARAQIASHYCKISSTPLNDFEFFRVLATLRIAVVFKQLHRRFLAEGATDARMSTFGSLADELLQFGLDVAEGRYI